MTFEQILGNQENKRPNIEISPELENIDDKIHELDAEFDHKSELAMEELTTLEEQLNASVANLKPSQVEIFKDKIIYLRRIIEDLKEDRDFDIDEDPEQVDQNTLEVINNLYAQRNILFENPQSIGGTVTELLAPYEEKDVKPEEIWVAATFLLYESFYRGHVLAAFDGTNMGEILKPILADIPAEFIDADIVKTEVTNAIENNLLHYDVSNLIPNTSAIQIKLDELLNGVPEEFIDFDRVETATSRLIVRAFNKAQRSAPDNALAYALIKKMASSLPLEMVRDNDKIIIKSQISGMVWRGFTEEFKSGDATVNELQQTLEEAISGLPKELVDQSVVSDARAIIDTYDSSLFVMGEFEEPQNAIDQNTNSAIEQLRAHIPNLMDNPQDIGSTIASVLEGFPNQQLDMTVMRQAVTEIIKKTLIRQPAVVYPQDIGATVNKALKGVPENIINRQEIKAGVSFMISWAFRYLQSYFSAAAKIGDGVAIIIKDIPKDLIDENVLKRQVNEMLAISLQGLEHYFFSNSNNFGEDISAILENIPPELVDRPSIRETVTNAFRLMFIVHEPYLVAHPFEIGLYSGVVDNIPSDLLNRNFVKDGITNIVIKALRRFRKYFINRPDEIVQSANRIIQSLPEGFIDDSRIKNEVAMILDEYNENPFDMPSSAEEAYRAA